MTPNVHEFQYLKKPARIDDTLTFSVQATNDVRIALSLLPMDNEDMYEVVLGGLGNTHSWIALGKEGIYICSITL